MIGLRDVLRLVGLKPQNPLLLLGHVCPLTGRHRPHRLVVGLVVDRDENTDTDTQGTPILQYYNTTDILLVEGSTLELMSA